MCLVAFSINWACRAPENDAELRNQIVGYIQAGDYNSARASAQQAMQNAHSVESLWRFKAQYIEALIALGDKQQADLQLRADVPVALGVLRPRYQYLKAYLAYRKWKKDPGAVELFESSVRLAQEHDDPLTEGEALNFLALLEESRQTEFYARALELARANHLDYLEAETLCNWGQDKHDVGHYAEAENYLQQGIRPAKLSRAHFVGLMIETNLAECYLKLGNLDRAAQSLESARAQLLPADPLQIHAGVDMELGKVASMRLDNSTAMEELNRAYSFVRKDPDLELYVPVVQKLAAGYLEQHDLGDAEHFNQLARDALGRQHDEYGEAWFKLNAGDIAVQRSQPKDAEHWYREVLNGNRSRLGDAEWSAYARLAELEAQQGRTQDASRDFESTVTAIEHHRSQQEEVENQIAFLSTLIHFYQQYVEFLVKQHKPWQALAVADSSRAAVLTQGAESDRSIQDFLPRLRDTAHQSNSAIVFYWLAPHKSWVWAVTPTTEDFKELPGEDLIAADVREYSNAIQSVGVDPANAQTPAGLRLYQTVVGPVAGHLKKGTRVVVVPDGALHELNFETLLSTDGGTPHYWLDDVTLAVAPSLRTLLDSQQNHQSSGKALIIGDGNYAGTNYPVLNESKNEVADLTKLFGADNATVLTGQRAVPEAYKKARPELFSVIHVSAHVEADKMSPLDSAIILSPGQYGNRELYARDLMSAAPLNADLVTISGCNSAGKKLLAGEGMVGFAWAAFKAGAHNTVTSLWETDDQSTRELMSEFYTDIRLRHKPYAQALHDAKLQIRAKYNKPYYWAAFQLYSRSLSQN